MDGGDLGMSDGGGLGVSAHSGSGDKSRDLGLTLKVRKQDFVKDLMRQ